MRLLVILLTCGACACGREAWLRASADRLEVFTNAGERTAREAAGRLLRARSIFTNISGRRTEPPLPVRVMLFASESEFRRYRPSASTSGFFQSGPDRDYIVLHAGGEQVWRIALHEYVHLVLQHSTAVLPRWLEEGTAEFYSTLQESGEALRIGRPVAAHLETLAGARWLNAGELEAAERYSEGDRAGIFYAQSWALVHMLNLSPEWRDSLPRLADLLAAGRPASGAFTEAFGRSLEAALAALRQYVSARPLPAAGVEPPPLAGLPVTVVPLAPLDSGLALAELLALSGNGMEADRLYARLAREHPKSPAAQAGLGAAALRAKRYGEARDRLKRAIGLGSRDASTYFEYGMLLREQGGPPAEAVESLRAAATLNPRHAEANFLLGVIASEDGRHLDAVEYLLRATAVLPRQSYFWHALALAYHQLGSSGDARRAANRAADTASNRHEAEMARAAVKLTGEESRTAVPGRPPVTTPQSWSGPKGDRRLEGTLLSVDCSARPVRLQVRNKETVFLLSVPHPDKVEVRNATSGSFAFPCGAQEPRQVVIEYSSPPDSPGTAGEVTAIEFR